MFRVNLNPNSPAGGQSSVKFRFNKSVVLKFLGGVLAVIVGIGIWTHGTFKFGHTEEELLAARLETPMSLEWMELYFGRQICNRPSYCGPDADPDKDSLSNYQEYLFFTDPTDPDSDGDGFLDGEEVNNFQNPIGAGVVKTTRDVDDILEEDPVGEALMKYGLEEIEKGNIMTLEQIQEAASKLTELPEFNEMPFELTLENNQSAVDEYLRLYFGVTSNYLGDPSAALANIIADSTNKDDVEKYIKATSVYAGSLVAIPTPTDIFPFHKAMFGSLIYQVLIAETQLDFLNGKYKDTEARERIRVYSIYYTRFIQDAARAARNISTKYNFPVSSDN